MTRTICSTYWQPLEESRNYRVRGNRKTGFRHIFRMPAAPRDGYVLLPVQDMEEDYQFSKMSPHSVFTDFTTGEIVAKDLVDAWGGNHANEIIGGPGIFICMDLDEKDATGEIIRPATMPSDRELQAARTRQTNWANAWCLEASDYKVNGKQKLIRDVPHRAAALWLGKKYSWLEAEEQQFVAECPACGTNVKPGKYICPACGTNYNPTGFEEWKRVTQQTAEAVAALRDAAKAANPDLSDEDLATISIGTNMQALSTEPESKERKAGNGRHIYG